MFTCIEFLPEKEGFFTKIYEKIKSPQPEREYVQVKGASAFLRLIVRENNIDWCKISSCLSGNERTVLLEEGREIPPQVAFKRYEPLSLGMVLMFKVLCRILENVGSAEKITLNIFDENGVLASYIDEIVPLVRNAYVYTENINSYFFASSRIMHNSGMNIKISEYETERNVSGIVISDRYMPFLRDAGFVFLGSRDIIAYNTVTGGEIFLEDEYKVLKSTGIDDFTFASALYERNNAKSFCKKDFTSIYFAGKLIDETKLAELIKQKIGSA